MVFTNAESCQCQDWVEKVSYREYAEQCFNADSVGLGYVCTLREMSGRAFCKM